MSELDYAIDILKDDLNELRQMQAVPKYAMDGKLYIERTNSLHAAIKTLEQANGVTTGEKQCNLPVVSGSAYRDDLLDKTHTMQQFAKENYKTEYYEGILNAMRNMRVHITKLYSKHYR